MKRNTRKNARENFDLIKKKLRNINEIKLFKQENKSCTLFKKRNLDTTLCKNVPRRFQFRKRNSTNDNWFPF